jgi:hypothetical protein
MVEITISARFIEAVSNEAGSIPLVARDSQARIALKEGRSLVEKKLIEEEGGWWSNR